MKNSSLGTKIIMAVITLAVLTYFGMQMFAYYTDPLTTSLAYSYQVENTIDLNGYVVRSERLLDETEGLVRVRRSEGERVSAGGTVAMTYADQASLNRQEEIESLNDRIEQLRYAQDAALGAEASLKLDAQITRNLLEYRQALAGNRLDVAEKRGGELRALVLKRDYSHADTENLAAQVERLEAQLKEMKSQAEGSVQRITSPESGLYSAVVDGYEAVLTPESIAAMLPSDLAAVRSDSAVKSDMGKLILGDTWYYAATVSAEEAEILSETKQLTLRFSKSIERTLDVTLEQISEEENGKVVVIFSSREYLAELTMLRQQSGQIVCGTVEGIRIPKEALRARKTTQDIDGTRTETEELGIYCMVGAEARFKPVEILYNGDGFALVRSTAPADREALKLRPGDEIVITAKNLYDGKVLA